MLKSLPGSRERRLEVEVGMTPNASGTEGSSSIILAIPRSQSARRDGYCSGRGTLTIAVRLSQSSKPIIVLVVVGHGSL
jgi:hypothetical protein